MSARETDGMVKQALGQIRDLRARLAAAEAASREPIAIIGMGLRFPGGATDAQSFADLLWEGRDAIREVPASRWDVDRYYDPEVGKPGRMVTRFGGFLDDVDRFDAEFFGISPREAASMDPQQRLLLEVAWEALEDAGIAADALGGSSTGVYLGISNSDYGRALLGRSGEREIYASTGASFSVAAGRIAYQLGLKGPSVAVDTACSSSLVAIHLAAQALRGRECDLALAAGVNLILTPELHVVFSEGRMLAPDGRCKSFDAAADGYVRGEGCAAIVLARLSDAEARGDRIIGIIRGSAINQDGRSSGLTAPNGPSQEAVIRAALAAAKVAPEAISYVETHGTGTPLGDPIEVGSLANVLALDSREQPLLIGSVKTNVGHLEAAAGVAGVIKVLLGFERGEIPGSLHFRAGNPHIDWSRPLAVAGATTAWSPSGGTRLAGVSAFGFAGCNAHVVLEEPPQPVAAIDAAEPPRYLLPLSAASEEALRHLAARYRDRLDDAAPLAGICRMAQTGRAHLSHRAVVSGRDARELGAALEALTAGRSHPALVSGEVGETPRVAFVFTGQGAQHPRMATELYRLDPRFRAELDAVAAVLDPHLETPLLDLLADERATIDGAALAQPLTFAVQVALARLWQSWGIAPIAVAGHSLGAYAAACVAGAISLDQAARLVAARGRLTEAHALPGAMAAVFAPEGDITPVTAALGVEIAAHNGPAHCVISGDAGAVAAALGKFEAQGIRTRELRVRHAAHSHLIEPVIAALRAELETVSFTAAQLPFVSDLTGKLAGDGDLAVPDYWLRHLREPVRFADALETLAALGATHFVEVGSHPVLLPMVAETLGIGEDAILPSLRRGEDEWATVLDSLARLHVAGARIDWARLDPAERRRKVRVPTYPFAGKRHWVDSLGDDPPELPDVDRWARLTEVLDLEAERGPLGLDVGAYPAKWRALERLTTGHAAQVLRAAGLFAQAGATLTAQEVLEQAGIDGSYLHLVRRWLDGLVADEQLRADGQHYVADLPLADPDLDGLWRNVEAALAENQPLLAYVRHCGSLLERVITGRESPLETLFPGSSFALAEALYERSSTMLYFNQLAGAGLASIAAGAQPSRMLRILEIGGGTGGTTSSLLRVLPADRVSYRFTDVSEVFLDRARERFAAAYPFVDYGLFDLDHDAAQQGLEAGSFDVIVSANAVHAVKDLAAALDRLGTLLAPGGIVLLVESTVHLPYFDMTTGLIEGWQHFADDIRGDNPLLPAARWTELLKVAGFAEARAWPKAGSPAEALGQHVIAASAPGEAILGRRAERDASAIAAGALSLQPAQSSRRGELDAAPPELRLELLRGLVRDQVVQILRLDPDRPPARRDRFMDLGMDSLMAIQLRNRLSAALELETPLTPTLMFDHPTIDAAADHLAERFAPASDADARTPAAPENHAPGLDETMIATMSDDEIARLLEARAEP